jgi:hypothetical protein
MTPAALHAQPLAVARQVSDAIGRLLPCAPNLAALRAAVEAVCPYEDEERRSRWRRAAAIQLAAVRSGTWVPPR